MTPPEKQDGHVVMPEQEFEKLLELAAERGAKRPWPCENGRAGALVAWLASLGLGLRCFGAKWGLLEGLRASLTQISRTIGQRVRDQARMAAISGPIPSMFMTRVRL